MERVRIWGVVALVSAVGLALRWPSPDRQVEYDEVISILFARLDFGQLVQATAADTMPPLYYTLLHFWRLATGDDLFHARLLSTLLSTLTIPLLFLLGRRLLDAPTALLASALLALSPFHAFYGHYARMYALLAFLGLLAALGFLSWLQHGNRRGLLLFLVAMGASLYAHNLAILLLLSLDLLFLVTRGRWPGREPRSLRELLIANGVLAFVFIPWLVYLPGQIEKITTAFWIPRPGAAELVRTAVVYHFHLPLPEHWLGGVGFLALLLVTITAIETRRAWLAHSGVRTGLLTLATLALAPPGLMFLVSQAQPVYVERGVMVSSAAYYPLLASALLWLPFRPAAWVLSAALALGIGASHSYQMVYEAFPRSPFSQVASYLETEVRPGDLVLHDNKLIFFPLYYFAPELPQAFLADPPGSPNDTLARGSQDALGLHPVELPEGIQGSTRVWLVVFNRALKESEAIGQPLASKAWLDQRYPGELRQHIGDLYLYLYRTEP